MWRRHDIYIYILVQMIYITAASDMSQSQESGQAILKKVMMEFYVRHGCNKDIANQKMHELFDKLERKKYEPFDLTHIETFMKIYRWAGVFKGSDNQSLRDTLRAIQKMYWQNYGKHYGVGDVRTDVVLSACNPYAIEKTARF